MMVKYGKLIEPEQHHCYVHGIHLAVGNFLYSPTSNFIERPMKRNSVMISLLI